MWSFLFYVQLLVLYSKIQIRKRARGCVYGAQRHFQQYFSYIAGVCFIGRGNRSTWRKPPTVGKQLVNFITIWFWFDFWCFNATFTNISAISWRPGSRSTRREPPTMGKQLVNLITCGCESSSPFFCNLQSQARTHAVLVIGLHELLDQTT